MEAHAEFLGDKLGDAGGRPEVGGKPEGGGFLGEPAQDLGLLIGREEWRSSGRGGASESGVTGLAIGLHPLGDGDHMDAEELGHGPLGLTSEHSFDAEAATIFFLGGRQSCGGSRHKG
jgi:hypothetical protein